MDISFKCPNCDQELEVDATGAGSEIECPACSKVITVPIPDNLPQPAPIPAGAPQAQQAKPEKHFSVPVHTKAGEALIQKPSARPLDLIAKEGDKTLRIKTFKRTECQEVGKDHFDEVVSAFLEKVGQSNIVNIVPVCYSYTELSSRQTLTDYGVLVVFKG